MSASSRWSTPRPARASRSPPASRRVRERFSEAALQRRVDLQHTLRRTGAQHLVLATDRDWLLDVARFVQTARRRAGGLDDPGGSLMHFLAPGRLWFFVFRSPSSPRTSSCSCVDGTTRCASRTCHSWPRSRRSDPVGGATSRPRPSSVRSCCWCWPSPSPAHQRKVARERGTVILAIDVSNSMGANDVAPNRLAAAVDAARSFVEGLPDKLQVGLILYDGTPRVVSPPTDDHQAVANALSKAKLGPGTATGEAIFTALDSIGTIDPDTQAAGGPPPAMIVVMSDGTTTVGRPDDVAIEAAKAAGVPVSTIAYGTPDGTITIEGQTVAVPADDAALQAIAEGTGGQFFSAESGDQLRQVYDQIGKTVGFDVETREVTATFVGFALVLLTLAAAASLFWSSRLV